MALSDRLTGRKPPAPADAATEQAAVPQQALEKQPAPEAQHTPEPEQAVPHG